MIKALLSLLLTFLFWSCQTVRETGENFDQEQSVQFDGYYTKLVADSGRFWHSPDTALPVEISGIRVISTCTILPPTLEATPDGNGLFVQIKNEGPLNVNCPVATSSFDTLISFPEYGRWADRDTLVLYAMSIVVTDTSLNDTLSNESDRKLVPIDTLMIARGVNRTDTFLFETDSFRVYEQETRDKNLEFGLVKVASPESLATLIYEEWKYTCQPESYEPCAEQGFEWDTLDAFRKISDSLRLYAPGTALDTLKRSVYQTCTNGKSLCPLSYRDDSLVVAKDTVEWSFRQWDLYFWEKTGDCAEWNLRRDFGRRWLPVAPGTKWNRNAYHTVIRERFDKKDCAEKSPEKVRFLNLESNLEMFDPDTLARIEAAYQELEK